MKIKIIKLFLIVIQIFVYTNIFSSNYYIDPQNGTMKNDGSFNNPWSTLDSVMQSKYSQFVGGDTLFLRDGFHGNDISLDGNPSAPIVIIAQSGSKPILLNLKITGSNWTLNNLNFTPEGNEGNGIPGTFDNGTFLILSITSKNNIIQNCNFYSGLNVSNWEIIDWRKNVWSGIKDYGKSNVIRNNHLFNIAYALQLMEVCDSADIVGNVIENFSGDGIRIAGADYCLIESNVIKNSIELDSNTQDGNHEDGIQAWDFDDGVNGLIVRGNYILNYENPNQKFKGLLQGIGFFDGFYNNCIIENNIVIVEHWHGISLYGAKDSRIINNTVLPNPGGSRKAGPPWIGIFSHKDGRKSTGNIVRNNLATNSNLNNSGADIDHNIFNRSVYKFCENYNAFDFYPNPDFTLNGKSIIDSGDSLDAPVIDFNGTKRPQGNGYDIGAYEYSDSISFVVDNYIENKFNLFQNYPNPFNPFTTIQYSIPIVATHELPLQQHVQLKVYDILGKEIITLVNQKQKMGNYQIEFNATELPSGIYFYTLKVGKYFQTKKMLLLK